MLCCHTLSDLLSDHLHELLSFCYSFLAVGLGWSAGLGMLGFARRHGPIISKISGVALLAVGLLYLSGHAELFAQWAPRLGAP